MFGSGYGLDHSPVTNGINGFCGGYVKLPSGDRYGRNYCHGTVGDSGCDIVLKFVEFANSKAYTEGSTAIEVDDASRAAGASGFTRTRNHSTSSSPLCPDVRSSPSDELSINSLSSIVAGEIFEKRKWYARA